MKCKPWVFQAFVLSLALNAALIVVFVYFLIHDDPLHFSYRVEEKIHTALPPEATLLLDKLPLFSFEKLMEMLEDERGLQMGYKIQDVALGALTHFHDFDTKRALGRGNLSKSIWVWGENRFVIFPGLNSGDFKTLKHFAQNERWPYTTRGLFKKIQSAPLEQCDPALLTFFCHTPEFVLVETLFARTHLPIQRRSILKLILESGVDQLETFAAKQQVAVDFSDDQRRAFLLDALRSGSKMAAELFLLTDSAYAYEHLDDQEMASLFKTLPEKELSGHFVKKPVDKELRPPFRQAPPASPSSMSHVIQEGESLWMIAKKHRISLERLMEENQLKTNVIRPGKTLKIPPSD